MNAARFSATVSASAEARVATRAAFAARATVAERLFQSRPTTNRRDARAVFTADDDDDDVDESADESVDEPADVTELETLLRSLRRAGRLALSPAAGHDINAARAAALELFSTRALLAGVARKTIKSPPLAESTSLGAGVLLRVADASANSDAAAFLASCVACLRAAHSASSMLAAAGDATRRAEVAASLAADACPPAAAARA